MLTILSLFDVSGVWASAFELFGCSVCYGLGAIARERLLAFVADLEEERNSFPGLDDAAGQEAT